MSCYVLTPRLIPSRTAEWFTAHKRRTVHTTRLVECDLRVIVIDNHGPQQ